MNSDLITRQSVIELLECYSFSSGIIEDVEKLPTAAALDELKPCPFCGGEARLFVNDGVRVICTKCKAQTNTMMDTTTDAHRFNSVRAAISRWNRRTEDGKQNGIGIDLPICD